MNDWKPWFTLLNGQNYIVNTDDYSTQEIIEGKTTTLKGLTLDQKLHPEKWFEYPFNPSETKAFKETFKGFSPDKIKMIKSLFTKAFLIATKEQRRWNKEKYGISPAIEKIRKADRIKRVTIEINGMEEEITNPDLLYDIYFHVTRRTVAKSGGRPIQIQTLFCNQFDLALQQELNIEKEDAADLIYSLAEEGIIKKSPGSTDAKFFSKIYRNI